MAGISMSRRTLALVVSIVLAGVATVALISYIRGIEDRSLKGQEPVEVFVAKEDIPAGTSGDFAISRGLFSTETIPRKVLATGAIRSLEEIRNKVAGVTIIKGEQIIATRFVAPGQAGAAGDLLVIPRDRQAMSVQVGIVPGVSGFIQVGDHISIIADLTITKRGGPTGQTENRVQFLLQDIEVLALGRRVIVTNPQGGQTAETQQPQDQVLVTVAVTPVQAEKLAFAVLEGGGKLHFTLLPKGQRPATTPGRTRDNAFA